MLTTIMKWASVVVLLAAMFIRPTAGFALFVQFVVCAAAVMVVVQSFQIGKTAAAIVFMAVATFFNPIVPLGFPPALLLGIRGFCLALFLISVLTFRAQPRLSMASITDRTPGSESL